MSDRSANQAGETWNVSTFHSPVPNQHTLRSLMFTASRQGFFVVRLSQGTKLICAGRFCSLNLPRVLPADFDRISQLSFVRHKQSSAHGRRS